MIICPRDLFWKKKVQMYCTDACCTNLTLFADDKNLSCKSLSVGFLDRSSPNIFVEVVAVGKHNDNYDAIDAYNFTNVRGMDTNHFSAGQSVLSSSQQRWRLSNGHVTSAQCSVRAAGAGRVCPLDREWLSSLLNRSSARGHPVCYR